MFLLYFNYLKKLKESRFNSKVMKQSQLLLINQPSRTNNAQEIQGYSKKIYNSAARCQPYPPTSQSLAILQNPVTELDISLADDDDFMPLNNRQTSKKHSLLDGKGPTTMLNSVISLHSDQIKKSISSETVNQDNFYNVYLPENNNNNAKGKSSLIQNSLNQSHNFNQSKFNAHLLQTNQNSSVSKISQPKFNQKSLKTINRDKTLVSQNSCFNLINSNMLLDKDLKLKNF